MTEVLARPEGATIGSTPMPLGAWMVQCDGRYQTLVIHPAGAVVISRAMSWGGEPGVSDVIRVARVRSGVIRRNRLSITGSDGCARAVRVCAPGEASIRDLGRVATSDFLPLNKQFRQLNGLEKGFTAIVGIVNVVAIILCAPFLYAEVASGIREAAAVKKAILTGVIPA